MDKQDLTKKEKYLLKKQAKQEERQKQARKKKTKKIIKIALPVFVIAGAIIIGLILRSPEQAQGTAKIEIDAKEYNAGTVSMKDGLVKHTYQIKNTGDGDLKINNIKTSCMCTTAKLKVGDKTSPEFGMHDNPAFWSQEIAPDQTGFLEVVFDPAFHGPQGTGPVIRAIYLSTNDPENKKVELRLIANIVK